MTILMDCAGACQKVVTNHSTYLSMYICDECCSDEYDYQGSYHEEDAIEHISGESLEADDIK
jgi:hypothetical protein